MAIAFNGLGCSLSLLAPAGDFDGNAPPAAHFSHQLEKWAKEPFETEGFKTSFPVCKSYILPPADTGNWRISTIAAATWATEEV